MKKNTTQLMILMIVVILSLSAQLAAQTAQPGCSICNLSSDGYLYLIDARPGYTEMTAKLKNCDTEIKRQQTAFKKSDRVRVILTNMNPFRYEYTVKIDALPIVESAIPAFFRLISDPLDAAIKAMEANKTIAPQFSQPSFVGVSTGVNLSRFDPTKTPSACDADANDALTYLHSKYNALKKLETDHLSNKDSNFTIGFKKVSETYGKAEAGYAETLQVISDPMVDSRKLCATMLKFQDNLKPLNKMIDDKKGSFSKLQKVIDFVFEHQNVLLRQEVPVGEYHVPTNVSITVERKSTTLIKIDSDPETVSAQIRQLRFLPDSNPVINSLAAVSAEEKKASVILTAPIVSAATPVAPVQKLEFGGGPRFSVSAGVVVSSIQDQEYQSVIGIARDRNGDKTNGDTLTSIVGYKENTSYRVRPMVMLNTRLWQTPSWGLHGSFGVAGKVGGSGAAVEYFVGPLLSFLENKLFLTVGPYIGRQDRLAGDLFQHASLTGFSSVPIVKKYHVKLGSSLTFKIK